MDTYHTAALRFCQEQIQDIARDLRAPFSKNDYVPATIADALDALDALAEFLDAQSAARGAATEHNVEA